MDDNYTLTIEINNKNPIELTDLTISLLSLADEYKRFIIMREGTPAANEVKLYVREVRSGSAIFDLQAIAPGIFPFINYAVTVIDFGVYTKAVVDFFLGKTNEKVKLDKRSYENFSKFVEPVAKDNGAQLNCHGNVNSTVNNFFILGSNDANAMQNRIQKEICALEEPLTGKKENVVLYWYQARNDAKSRAGDFAIIESIQAKPVKAIVDESIKSAVLSGDENLFNLAYLVDVDVETIDGKPKLYKIIALHDTYSRD